MFPDRISRVESLMAAEISRALEDFKENIAETSGPVLVTVTSVEVDRNLEKARVHYSWTSVEPGEDTSRRVQEALEAVEPQITQELMRRMTIKRLPKLSFVYDESVKSADRVLKILNSLEKEPQK